MPEDGPAFNKRKTSGDVPERWSWNLARPETVKMPKARRFPTLLEPRGETSGRKVLLHLALGLQHTELSLLVGHERETRFAEVLAGWGWNYSCLLAGKTAAPLLGRLMPPIGGEGV